MARPASSATKITCSICPSTMAVKGLVGTMFTRISVTGGEALPAKSASTGISSPVPGCTRKASAKPMDMAMAVVVR